MKPDQVRFVSMMIAAIGSGLLITATGNVLLGISVYLLVSSLIVAITSNGGRQ